MRLLIGSALSLRSAVGVVPTDTGCLLVQPARLPEPMLQARRKATGRKSVPQALPSLAFDVLAAVKCIVESADAVTALTLSGCATELKRQRLGLLGTKP